MYKMPRINDMSYNSIFSRPEFYSKEQREEYIQKRIDRYILEDELPPVPTRQQELDYLEFLEKDLRKDKWIHSRFRKLQAGPLRIPYKKSRSLLTENRIVGCINFLVGAALVSPLAVYVGRTMRKTVGGVPKVYSARNYYNFPNVNPDHYARIRFRMGFFAVLAIGGYSFATFWTPNVFKDEYYSRPDLKPIAPMVEDTPKIKKAKEDFYNQLYNEPLSIKPGYNLRHRDRSQDNDDDSFKKSIMAFPSGDDMHEHHWH